MAPVWVVLGSGLFIGESVGRQTVHGLGLCIAGAAALIGASYRLDPGHLTGDVYGVATSFFFGAYFSPSKRPAARRFRPHHLSFLARHHGRSPGRCPGVRGSLPAGQRRRSAALAALALVSHMGGQGFLTFALGHLPAAFSSLVIFIEAIAAALFAWVLLGEPVSAFQAAGGALILAGIFVARLRDARDGHVPAVFLPRKRDFWVR